jgi:hypothetical protein
MGMIFPWDSDDSKIGQLIGANDFRCYLGAIIHRY